jgi:hypothetical protein
MFAGVVEVGETVPEGVRAQVALGIPELQEMVTL